MNIFKQIKSSVYNPSYYRDVLGERRFSSSLKYFLKYVLLLAVLTAIVVSITVVPVLPGAIKGAVENTLVQYPDDLEVTIAKGKASSSKDAPVVFSLDLGEKIEKQEFDNFLVIDTKTPFTIDGMVAHKTASLLTSDSLFINDGRKLQSYPLTKVEDQVITKETVRNWGDKLERAIPIIIPLVIIGIFLIAFIVYMSALFFVLFLALLIFLLLRVVKTKVTYKKAYQIGLHAVTLPLVIDMLNFVGMNIHIRFLSTLLALLIVCINLKEYIKPKSQEIVHAPISETA